MNASGGGVHTAEHAETNKQRRASWLWLLVFVQVAIPASYYLRGDRDDERFAWRMFSAVRVQSCRVRAWAFDGAGEKTRIDLEASLHSAWVRSLERGRSRVITHFLAQQCARERLTYAELVRSCKDAAQRDAGETRYALDCRNGKLVREPVR